MSEAWNELQALKSKKLSLREKIAARKELIAKTKNLTGGSSDASEPPPPPLLTEDKKELSLDSLKPLDCQINVTVDADVAREEDSLSFEEEQQIEEALFHFLRDNTLNFPVQLSEVLSNITKQNPKLSLRTLQSLLNKLSIEGFLNLHPNQPPDQTIITSVNHTKINVKYGFEKVEENRESDGEEKKEQTTKKRVQVDDATDVRASKVLKKSDPTKCTSSLEDLLSTQSAMDRASNKSLDDIYLLLNTPTALESKRNQKFMSKGGRRVREYCRHGTRLDCSRFNVVCAKLHFRKIIHQHTDESLGDCSFLNTCFHMETCKYVHYTIDFSDPSAHKSEAEAPKALAVTTTDSNRPINNPINSSTSDSTNPTTNPTANPTTNPTTNPATNPTTTNNNSSILYPPQWIQSDLRNFNMDILGKFSVVMADPPWDIHMELPYGTMSDEEMRKLSVPVLQDHGYIFLWVTGRAMELGRECLSLWGYERVDEVIWVKTNQLQRIIRTGRTGHWLNHGKEHCLVGVKGNPKVNKGVDCDVIVSEVRATSHKPDEIYGIIERLSPGTRKLELFGRPHNTEANWITLGNQLDGVKLLDPEVVKAFKLAYPSGSAV